MATCNYALSGLTLECESNKGGIKEVYVASYAPTTAMTAFAEAAATGDTAQTEIAATALTGSSVTWHKYEFRRNTGSMTSTLNVDDAAGTNYVTTEVVLQFGRMATKKRIEMRALSLNDLMAVVVDSNGTAWLLGLNEPVVASAGTGQTGTAKADANMYQITLQANDDSYPYAVSGDLSVLVSA